MDDKTRGLIEKSIDEVMEEEWVLDIEWIPEIVPIKSLQDIALGYMVGSTVRFAHTVVLLSSGKEPTPEDNNEIQGMLKRRIPEIMERIISELSR